MCSSCYLIYLALCYLDRVLFYDGIMLLCSYFIMFLFYLMLVLLIIRIIYYFMCYPSLSLSRTPSPRTPSARAPADAEERYRAPQPRRSWAVRAAPVRGGAIGFLMPAFLERPSMAERMSYRKVAEQAARLLDSSKFDFGQVWINTLSLNRNSSDNKKTQNSMITMNIVLMTATLSIITTI